MLTHHPDLANNQLSEGTDAETCLIGSVLRNGSQIDAVSDLVSSRDFAEPWRGRLWDGILAIYASQDAPASTEAWVTRFHESKLGKIVSGSDDTGIERVVDCMESVPHGIGASYYAKVVADKAQLRNLITAAERIIDLTGDQTKSSQEILSESEQLIFSVNRTASSSAALRVSDLVRESIEQAQKRHITGDEGRIKTGWHQLDSRFVDLREGALVVLGADSGAGKTSLALNLAENMSLNSIPVMFFSVEMSPAELADRLVCSHTNLTGLDYRKGRVPQEDWPQLDEAFHAVKQADLYIADTPGLSLDMLSAMTRRAVKDHQIRVIVIDYLQIMAWPNPNSERESLGTLTAGLKALARRLNVAVILLSQLTKRSAEFGQAPSKGDLHGSSSIYKDADAVLLLWRPDLYQKQSLTNTAELLIEKARNGPRFQVAFDFDPERTRFYEKETNE